MKNIPKSLREKLEEVSFIGNLKIELSLKSKVDKTRKYLFELNDGNIIESVMMDYEDRVTVCISNQVGCRMGCRFCASTLEGLIRNLEPWEIKDILDACKYYIKKTNRRVTIEYSLIKGVNDSEKEAQELIRLLKGMLCHVNLIPVNNVEERDFKRPDKSHIYRFRDILEKNNIPATVRISMGSDIGGACGQLRRKHK